MSLDLLAPSCRTDFHADPLAVCGVLPDSVAAQNLDQAAQADARMRNRLEAAYQNRLAGARLGLASGLFVALRAKHEATAAHSLRVAVGCSAWSFLLDLSALERDALEVAALLHDVGKIGIPDDILLKETQLSESEVSIMNGHREHAREILQRCCASQQVLDIVYFSPAWYDGRRHGFDRCGEELPRCARILSIVDAFDAMTNHQVYRHALTREQALAELYEHAGTQFDPQLVGHFNRFVSGDHERLRLSVASRWLGEFQQRDMNGFWREQASQPIAAANDVNRLFHEQFLENMHASVVFVDRDLRILKWSRACETLTGISAAHARQQRWDPSLLQMRDEFYKLIPPERCPVIKAMCEGQQQRMRLIVANTGGGKVSVDGEIGPVKDASGEICGATLLMFDASPLVDLEQQMETLHERASLDGLTKVANRAEFDRVHDELVRRHRERGTPYSMIICDLDHFKRINDSYGHQAGDAALITFASLLQKSYRNGDLVARYGGEEFVLLCPDCDQAAAAVRAEGIRQAWAVKSHPTLGGKCITASFGVTELQAGDTPEIMLRRADRALLQAKESGRNAVVQLGCGMVGEPRSVPRPKGWLAWLRRKPVEHLLQRRLISAAPLVMCRQKMRGFIADQAAEILEAHEDRLVLQVAGAILGPMRRTNDRPTPYLLEVQLEELPPTTEGGVVHTAIHVAIRPKRERDRRRRNSDERAKQLLVSLKAYLMAQEEAGPS